MDEQNQGLPEDSDAPDNGDVVSDDYTTAVGATILGLVFLLGVPGNLFVIWSILWRAQRRSVTAILILNLACADGFLMTLSLFFIVYLAQQTWALGTAMCKALFYLCNANMYASIFLITLMSLHRLLAVVWPVRARRLTTRRAVRRVVAGTWALVALISVPSVVFREVIQDTDDRNRSRLVCAPNHTLPRHVQFHYTLETVSGFVLPYTAILTSYILILRRLRQTKFKRNMRTEKLILAVVVMFGVFWLPYHVINMMQVAAEWYRDGATKRNLRHISSSSRPVTSALAFISSCANPVLYTFAGKAYIKRDGLGFMARLFEGTSLEQTGRKGRQMNARDMGVTDAESTTNGKGVNAARAQEHNVMSTASDPIDPDWIIHTG